MMNNPAWMQARLFHSYTLAEGSGVFGSPDAPKQVSVDDESMEEDTQA